MRGVFQGSALKLLMEYKIKNLPIGVSKSHHISANTPIAQRMPVKRPNFKGFLGSFKIKFIDKRCINCPYFKFIDFYI